MDAVRRRMSPQISWQPQFLDEMARRGWALTVVDSERDMVAEPLASETIALVAATQCRRRHVAICRLADR